MLFYCFNITPYPLTLKISAASVFAKDAAVW